MAGYTLTDINKLRITNQDRESWYEDYVRNLRIIDQKLLSTGSVTSTMIAAGSITNTHISGSAAIARSKLASGTADHVLINDGSGVMTSEAQLSKSRGGTGADNSSVTFPSTGTIVTRNASETLTNKTIDGDDNTVQDLALTSLKTVLADANKALVRDASGIVTSARITNTNVDASAAIAYSKLNLATSIVNADIAGAAAIARSKLASGTASHVIINDGSGVLSSEAQLAVSRGGTGISLLGTANQLLGVDSDATTNEYKSLSVDTAGSDFEITHAANSITFNLPTASAVTRGALSSADWSTFNNKIAGSGTDGQVALFNGAGSITSDSSITYSTGANTNNISLSSSIKVGTNSTVAGTAGAGAIRYNAGVLEYSDGMTWNALGVAGAGILSLNGLLATAQTFANDTNVTISSATSTHTIGWSGQLAVSRGGTGLSSLGSANQILGVDNGVTAAEYKTLSVGTSGTDFAIAHSAGAIAFNLPDAGASARGAVTIGTQTFGGQKTFQDLLTKDASTASQTISSGSTQFAPNLDIQSGHTYTNSGELIVADELLGAGTLEGAGTTISFNPPSINWSGSNSFKNGSATINVPTDSATLASLNLTETFTGTKFFTTGLYGYGADTSGLFTTARLKITGSASTDYISWEALGSNSHILVFKNATITGYNYLDGAASTFKVGTSTAHDVDIVTNGSSRLKATSGGDINVISGNLVIGTSDKGVDFSATSNASGMTAELLNDYEIGTWTPTISFGGASAGITYNTRYANYTKVGNKVYCTAYIPMTSKGSSTGTARLGGLPFTSTANTFGAVNISYYFTMASINYFVGGYVESNSTSILLQQGGTVSTANLTDANFTDSTEIIMSFYYTSA